MSRRRIRQVFAIVILLLLLGLLTAAYMNYRSTRNIGVTVAFDTANDLVAPQYLYSFSGDGAERMARPIGVLAAQGKVFVADARRGVIDVFTPDGHRLAVWGRGKLVVPLYFAENPKTRQIWVSDRRLRAILIFDNSGKYVRTFDPKLPKDQLPTFATDGAVWAPVAMAFAPDGSLYVTEILKGHRMLIFDPSGSFKKSVGTAGLVNQAADSPTMFQFPNSIKVLGNEVWVSDSNNRRLQVFSRDGKFKRFVITQGLPRGFAFLPRANSKEPQRLVVIDTLAHDATIWDAKKASKVLSFGSQGVLEGQFSYPDDTSIDGKRRIFVTDTINGRVQVWGWPAITNPVPTPTTTTGWALCLSPVLLLPLLFLLRRRRYVATADFVEAMVAANEADRMVQPRVRWEAAPEDYERVKDIVFGDIRMGELIESVEHSESDVRALRDRYELDEREAIVLSIAQRAKLFCTEDQNMRRVARVLEVPVMDHVEFSAKYFSKKKRPEGGAEE